MIGPSLVVVLRVMVGLLGPNSILSLDVGFVVGRVALARNVVMSLVVCRMSVMLNTLMRVTRVVPANLLLNELAR